MPKQRVGTQEEWQAEREQLLELDRSPLAAVETLPLVTERVPLPTGGLQVLQPREGAEYPDERGVAWAPLAPYWSVLWRSGVALARELAGQPLDGRRGVEVGCGLALPSLVAARAGARMLATDVSEEALELLTLNARGNDVFVDTALVDWHAPQSIFEGAPFDFVLAADVLYEDASVAPLLALLPRLADEVWLADPDRAPARNFIASARTEWLIETADRDRVRVHRLRKR